MRILMIPVALCLAVLALPQSGELVYVRGKDTRMGAALTLKSWEQDAFRLNAWVLTQAPHSTDNKFFEKSDSLFVGLGASFVVGSWGNYSLRATGGYSTGLENLNHAQGDWSFGLSFGFRL